MSGYYNMTPAEFYQKCEWEGGICDAVFGYGLRPEDLNDDDPELKAALAELCKMEPVLDRFKKLLFKYE